MASAGVLLTTPTAVAVALTWPLVSLAVSVNV
jgi:hypothetical protein